MVAYALLFGLCCGLCLSFCLCFLVCLVVGLGVLFHFVYGAMLVFLGCGSGSMLSLLGLSLVFNFLAGYSLGLLRETVWVPCLPSPTRIYYIIIASFRGLKCASPVKILDLSLLAVAKT